MLTTGHPHANASIRTVGRASCREDRTNRLALCQKCIWIFHETGKIHMFGKSPDPGPATRDSDARVLHRGTINRAARRDNNRAKDESRVEKSFTFFIRPMASITGPLGLLDPRVIRRLTGLSI